MSLSTRRVWIEIIFTEPIANIEHSHSPHGECGLKFASNLKANKNTPVTLHTESVD